MHILEEDSVDEKLMQQLDDWLEQHNIQINTMSEITITINDNEYRLVDVTNSDAVVTLPRKFDTERLVTIE